MELSVIDKEEAIGQGSVMSEPDSVGEEHEASVRPEKRSRERRSMPQSYATRRDVTQLNTWVGLFGHRPQLLRAVMANAGLRFELASLEYEMKELGVKEGWQQCQEALKRFISDMVGIKDGYQIKSERHKRRHEQIACEEDPSDTPNGSQRQDKPLLCIDCDAPGTEHDRDMGRLDSLLGHTSQTKMGRCQKAHRWGPRSEAVLSGQKGDSRGRPWGPQIHGVR